LGAAIVPIGLMAQMNPGRTAIIGMRQQESGTRIIKEAEQRMNKARNPFFVPPPILPETAASAVMLGRFRITFPSNWVPSGDLGFFGPGFLSSPNNGKLFLAVGRCTWDVFLSGLPKAEQISKILVRRQPLGPRSLAQVVETGDGSLYGVFASEVNGL